MNMKSKAGFTLVELIVVIAILAILAGVAIPAYSGYMDKANKAADDQIVNAVNTAINAALAGKTATLDDDATKTKYANGIVVAFEGTDAATATTDYNSFINGTTVTFKYYNAITVNGNKIEGDKN